MSEETVRRSFSIPKSTADELSKMFDGNRKAQGAFLASIVEQAVSKMKNQKSVEVRVQIDMTRIK